MATCTISQRQAGSLTALAYASAYLLFFRGPTPSLADRYRLLRGRPLLITWCGLPTNVPGGGAGGECGCMPELPRRTGATTARCSVHAVAAARNDLIVGVQRVVEAGAEGHDAQSRTSPRMPSTRCVIGAIRSVTAIRRDGEQVGAVRNSFCAATRLGEVA